MPSTPHLEHRPIVALLAALALTGLWLARCGGRHEKADLAASVEAPRPDVPAVVLRDTRVGAEPEDPARAPAIEEGPGASRRETTGPAAGAIEFLVTDREGAPIAGARVRVLEPEELGPGTTDARGRCALGATRAESVVFEIEREGFAHLRARREVHAPIAVVLHPAVVARGQVRSRATGLPLAGAEVERVHGRPRSSDLDWFGPGGRGAGCDGCPPDRVRADADGRYEIGGVPCDPGVTLLAFRVRAERHASLESEFVLRACDASFTRDFELEAGRALSGDVVDFTSGVPVAGAVVDFGPERLVCDGDGRFATDRAPPAGTRESLVARAEGFCQLRAPLDGLESPCWLRLPRSATIVGTVRDAGGAPVGGARVGLWDQGGFDDDRPPELDAMPPEWEVEVHGDEWSATSGEDGAFRIRGAVPWRGRYALDVTAEGFEEAIVPLPPLGPGQELVQEVRLEPLLSGVVFGTLTLNGAPVAGIVRWRVGDQYGGEGDVQHGRYRIEHVSAGAITLTAVPNGQEIVPFAREAEVALALSPGAELRHDFELRLSTSTVAGRARSGDGRPLAGLDVRLATERSEPTRYGPGRPAWSASARCDADGAFRFTVPADGSTFVVSARHGAVKRTAAGMAAGTEGIELVFPVMGTLAYRAVDRASREPLEAYGLLWRAAGIGEAVWANSDSQLDPEGYRQVLLPAGSVDLYVTAPMSGHRMGTRESVRLAEGGDPARVTFELEPGHTVVIQLDPAGRPPRGAWITLPPAELWPDLGCVRGADGNNVLSSGGRYPARALAGLAFSDSGRCTVRGLAPGPHRFKVFHESMVLEPDTIRVPSPGDEPIVVRCSLGSR